MCLGAKNSVLLFDYIFVRLHWYLVIFCGVGANEDVEPIWNCNPCFWIWGNLPFRSSTRASNRSFYIIFNKRFDHLKHLLTKHRTKKVLSAGSLCGSLIPNLNAQNGHWYYPKIIMLQFQICYHIDFSIS